MIVPVVFFVSIIVFSFIHLIPGDIVDAMLGMRSTEEARTTLRHELGLDRPIIVQYWVWLSRALKGDLGKSAFTGQSVSQLIVEKLPATFLLAFASLIISAAVAIPLGVIAASKKNSVWDLGALSSALFATSFPSFWLGIMLILIFSVNLKVLPSVGYVPFFNNPLKSLYYLVLPAATLASSMLGAITRMTRSQMLEELGQDYVRTAQAKGLRQDVIVYKHALRNAINPVITVLGLQFGWTLGSAMVVEEVFGWPGVGRLVIWSIHSRDYPVLQGCVLVVSTLFVFVNLLVDVLYGLMNPRIKYQ
jgi:peptide/nickel transport system permease protein